MESRVCLTEEIEEYRSTVKKPNENLLLQETKRLDEPKSHNEVPESNFMFLVELRKKVMSFRDIMDLPPCNGSQAIRELLMMTNEELQRLYPEVVPSVPVSEMNEMSMHQGLKHFYHALKSIGDSWVKNHKWLAKFEYKESGEMKNIDSEEFGGRVLEKLAFMIKMARELFDEMEEEGKNSDKSPGGSKFEEILNGSYSNNDDGSFCHFPVTPNSVLPELSNSSAKSGEFAHSPTLTWPLRTSVRRLKPIDLNRLLVFPLLPHLSAPGSKTTNKRSKASKESGLETQEVKSNSMAKPDPATKEESGDCTAAYETQQITVSSSNQISSDYGGSSNSYTTPKMGGNPVLTLSVAASESPVESPQPKPSMLLPNVSQAPPPPQSLSAKSKPNVSLAAVAPPRQTKMALLPNVSTQSPPPPPLPKFLPYVACVIVWPCAQLLACVSTWPHARLCGWLHGPIHGYGHGRIALLRTRSRALAAWPGAWLHCPHGWQQAWLHISTHGCERRSSSPHMITTVAASPATVSPPSPQPPALLQNVAIPPQPLTLTQNVPPPPTPQSPPLPQNVSVPSPELLPHHQHKHCPQQKPQLHTHLHPRPSKGSLPSPLPPLPLKNGGAPTPQPTQPLLTLPPNATDSSAPAPAPAPPPPSHPSKGSLPSPPLPLSLKNGGAPPPPPPIGGTKALGPKKSNTKLKRSSFMGNLYRVLKGKVEGSSIDGKSSHVRKTQIGGSVGGKKGMADALAEMTKSYSFPYFQQIEEDVKKHAATIMELKKAINSFQTKDMAELLKFHQYIEHHLENLTAETQVLARFEDFPTRKLETLRMAAALYSRFHEIVTNLKSWKIVNPLCQLLDRVEGYFNKIKVEVDALERIKDEESKKFKSCNIHFDFDIILRIKELIVDISSGCMELALKERRR
ncbi:uncharacterized protein At4g04980-like [Macadamia integrifolia]|uniref:uncharacterized protein At4g04980-like n=1 Tax=Macadamia integrifolia TaxID=60698 RepID=UPI001C501712|nr:uncharacterized protein At4g04980-like [Macadamia integrifolia]